LLARSRDGVGPASRAEDAPAVRRARGLTSDVTQVPGAALDAPSGPLRACRGRKVLVIAPSFLAIVRASPQLNRERTRSRRGPTAC